MGSKVQAFEQELARFCSRKYAVTVSSCTEALYFSLLAAGVKPGDEVIVPSFSFIATVTPVLQAGAVPVFTDIRSDTLSMDADDLIKKITPKTKAIIFVHLFGATCPVQDIFKTACERNIFLIEDNAHSLGSTNDAGIKAGTQSHISCVSFDPTKIIGGFGTAGAALTDDESLFELLKKLGNQGKNRKTGQHDILGFNSRISDFQAAFLSYQLTLMGTFIKKRIQVAEAYNATIDTLSDIQYIQKERSVFHKYVILTNKRDDLRTYLSDKGIQTLIHYNTLLYEHPLFHGYKYRASHINFAPQITDKVLSLPIYPEMNDTEIRYVTENLLKFFN
ncbi:MAG: UDP-2-acetamido-2-deoxy-3-oxo-D-glucuronate aminotransferase [Bacteroidetes bacterium ADurb.Bin408]|nr:MAG: UDP-2-acetamido-2-deoxy-3-oxo-D-glucuronate aminotransferase [Bacteroidetes bacterium ADurb.Bin408]